MTTGGLFFMLSSILAVTLLLGWCIYRIVATPGEEEHMHGFEIETPDEKEEKK